MKAKNIYSWRRISYRGIICFLIIFIFSNITFAQYINLKTIPVATGNQFLLFPSQNMSMGGVLIAIDDPLLDPYVNPAKGSRLSGMWLHTSPAYYSISEDFGSGLTLPMGIVYRGTEWFGGLSSAFQNLKSAQSRNTWDILRGQKLSEGNLNNYYFFGMAGRNILDDKYSVGVSLFYADLSGMDGVDLLYGNSQRIEQFGHMADFRIGLISNQNPDRTFEILFLHSRVNMTHNVTYLDWWWGPWDDWAPSQARTETNLDRTRTWGLHLGFIERNIPRDWNLGGIFTFNYKTHPKIPNYELMNIPRDPGNTYAFNIGFGAAKMVDNEKFAIEFVYEPIWSNTWADTDVRVITASGNVIPPGGKTVENDFRFSNFHFRVGVGKDTAPVGTSIGFHMRSYRYVLDQTNFVEEFERTQRENWIEWTLSFGLTILYSEFRTRYNIALTMGTGRPGVDTAAFFTDGSGLRAGDFIVAPSGPLTLQSAFVFTHQLTFSVPLMR